MNAFKRRDGMTLIELMMVIAIIAIMTAATVPAFHIMSRSGRLRSGAKLITDTLSLARGFAITHRHSYYVEYDDEPDDTPDRVRVFYMPINPGNPDERFPPSDYDERVTVGEWEYLPDTIEFHDGSLPGYGVPDDYVRFKPNGAVYGGNPTNFAIVDTTTLDDGDAKAKTCVIKVLNVTGRVKAIFE